MPERVDAIVVGAGPAGTSAALALAQAGLKVAVFERGEQPGSKNMFGGVLYYTEVLDRILPDFWKEAPIERYVTRHDLVFMTDDSWTSVSFTEKQSGQPPYNAVTLLRARFDRWFAEKAREAGALFIPVGPSCRTPENGGHVTDGLLESGVTFVEPQSCAS